MFFLGRYTIIVLAVVLLVLLVWVAFAFTGPRAARTLGNKLASVAALFGVSFLIVKLL